MLTAPPFRAAALKYFVPVPETDDYPERQIMGENNGDLFARFINPTLYFHELGPSHGVNQAAAHKFTYFVPKILIDVQKQGIIITHTYRQTLLDDGYKYVIYKMSMSGVIFTTEELSLKSGQLF